MASFSPNIIKTPKPVDRLDQLKLLGNKKPVLYKVSKGNTYLVKLVIKTLCQPMQPELVEASGGGRNAALEVNQVHTYWNTLGHSQTRSMIRSNHIR